ncbi:methionyl-tRNA formyltransferase [Bifidobacterium sp.]|jgi:methionyl-tRNA formyltransferase|uniref:methionyl-tRNA formyltransferase n=1 Tax=Bifidobacterium sp. TaxID=41200 RepID=UPI0025BD9E99|nr:methionyl-tRNA formyltransferase [Bifidobacterium sp.]MCI1635534.1 methionyl-tRNA formyltransferase [Bifidobacterium sp.]
MKVLFAGTPTVAVPALQALAADGEHFEVVAVLTRPDAPQGRGRHLAASPVKVAAQELGIPVIESDPRDSDFIEQLTSTGAQLAAVVAYGKILRQPVLDALELGWYNLHFSLLPQWRGAAPVQRAIWSGESLSGATVFRITAGMDTGPIIAQSTTTIGAHETSGELLDRLAIDGAQLLMMALQTVQDGTAIAIEQPQGAYERAEKITVDDAHINLNAPVFAVDRQVRACTPEPGAWCVMTSQQDMKSNTQGTTLHVVEGKIADQSDPQIPQSLLPGHLAFSKKHVWLGTLTGPYELIMVKPQGKRAMKAADWVRGAHLDADVRCV